MTFSSWVRHVVDIKLAPNAPKPVRTPTPMQLSQGSAVTISLTPLILAEAAGALFKSDLPTNQRSAAVGQLSLMGFTFYRVYLTEGDGGFIHFATKGDEIIETRLYRRYPDVNGEDVIPSVNRNSEAPADQPDSAWEFWLADADGYIGWPVMQSRIEDGSIPYNRSWGGASASRLAPYQVVESVVSEAGLTTTLRHRMMHYSRSLTDEKQAEHLLVSAVEGDNVASVVFWLGLDLQPSDLTVYAAADAPEFHPGRRVP